MSVPHTSSTPRTAPVSPQPREASRSPRRTSRLVAAAFAGLAAVVALAAPAHAHLPVMLTEANTVSAIKNSPYLPDGTVSFAFYGWLDRPAQTRAVRLHLRAGQEFKAQILIPDLAPENTFARHRLPTMTIVCPGGGIVRVPSTQRVSFAEPYTGTNYLIIGETVHVAKAGTYAVIASGRSATRFVLATGSVEQRTGAIDNASIGSVDDVRYWYATPARHR